MRSPDVLQADAEHVDALFRQHAPAVRQLCRRRLGNERDAEDASQEALLRAWSARERYDPARPLWPWLATIAANVCIDVQRRAHLADLPGGPPDPPPSPEELALSREQAVVVREALGQLSPASQEVLFLRDVEGWSYSRIGRFAGRTAPAVRTAVTRARHQLRAQVEVVARAQGHWPLPVIGLLWARSVRRVRRARSEAMDLATRSVNLVDGSTGLATAFGSTTAVQTVVGALFMATAAAVGASAGLAVQEGPAPSSAVHLVDPAHAADAAASSGPASGLSEDPVVDAGSLPEGQIPLAPAAPTIEPMSVVALPGVDVEDPLKPVEVGVPVPPSLTVRPPVPVDPL